MFYRFGESFVEKLFTSKMKRNFGADTYSGFVRREIGDSLGVAVEQSRLLHFRVAGAPLVAKSVRYHQFQLIYAGLQLRQSVKPGGKSAQPGRLAVDEEFRRSGNPIELNISRYRFTEK